MTQRTTNSRQRVRRSIARLGRAVVSVAVLAAVLVGGPAPTASAQNIQTVRVWGPDSGQQWKYRQSIAGNDLGSASAADPALDDSAWVTKTLHLREIVGSNNANHFRKTFDVDSILPTGVHLSQVVGINVELQYDDAAVMYLNGTEVYRSIRGNLDPDYVLYAAGSDIPHNVNVPWGGAEFFYVQIPDPLEVNTCELPNAQCSASPYGSAQPPAVPASLLVPGNNTWSVTTWNNSAGGSGDTQLDHVFELVIDISIPAPMVRINEVVSSNAGSYQVQLDLDPELETPDWVELANIDPNDAADIGGWTIADASATWTFPAGTSIPAGGTLLVAANDGNDATSTPMQTNFKLAQGGDSLTLVTNEGIVADEYIWTDMFTDNSLGRPNNDHNSTPTYLTSATPGSINSGPLTQAPPILRYFRDRMFNSGEVVDLSIDAFDPDGDSLTYSLSSTPAGVTLDPATGLLAGSYNRAGNLTSTITVTDGDNDIDTQAFTWHRVGPPVGTSSPLVLNEYNAVPSDGELNAGSPIGNGGDWFEFLVVEDEVDLRGWTIEFRQRDGGTDELRRQTFATFDSNRSELARVPAGTIITVSEQNADDLSFDAVSDWSINLLMDNFGNGPFWETAAATDTFNSTHRDQTVLIRNAAGQVVTPLAGETDGWDAANGGVSGGEVMSLCVDAVQGTMIDPITDYSDNGVAASFGEPNTCYTVDPNNPANLIADQQNLAPLRASASLGRGTGDVNCDLQTNIVDALLIARLEVALITDDGPCLLDQGGPTHEASELAGDFNDDGTTNIVDALIIARCEAGLASPQCPNV